jgi:hypothetical protein
MEFEIAEEYYTLQLREAIDYCRGESDHLNAVASIDPTQILIDSVYQSAEKNAPVNIQET